MEHGYLLFLFRKLHKIFFSWTKQSISAFFLRNPEKLLIRRDRPIIPLNFVNPCVPLPSVVVFFSFFFNFC